MGIGPSVNSLPAGEGYRLALEANIRAFDAQPLEWKERWHGQFAIFHNGEFAGSFATFDSAARAAIKQFGRECYLIREVGISFSEAPTAIHITSSR
jgi:hypothetical protein